MQGLLQRRTPTLRPGPLADDVRMASTFSYTSPTVRDPEPMRRQALGTTLFFVLAPGVVAGLGPWLVTSWEFEPMPTILRALGAILIAAGLPVLVHSFVRFVTEGHGTPAPVAPTSKLVVGGLYRWVRNPMYLAVASIIGGQALLFGSPALVVYLTLFCLAVAVFVHSYEEPRLRAQFGAEYEAYCRAVPAWRPRTRPWSAPGADRARA
jgi:protein-S-isoprenylcysteine O-methyltransferase Ste14